MNLPVRIKGMMTATQSLGGAMNHDQIIPSTTHEQIEKRAYEIYEKRHQEDGHALEDWLKAESEIGKHLSAAEGGQPRSRSK